MVVKKKETTKKKKESDQFVLALESAIESENSESDEERKENSQDKTEKNINSPTPIPSKNVKSVESQSTAKNVASNFNSDDRLPIQRQVPPDTLKMICQAVNAIGDKRKGASVQAIRKWILHNYLIEPNKLKNSMKLSLKKGISTGILIRPKASNGLVGAVGSFLVAKKTIKPKKPATAKKLASPTKLAASTNEKRKIIKETNPKSIEGKLMAKKERELQKDDDGEPKKSPASKSPKKNKVIKKDNAKKKVPAAAASKDVKAENKEKPKKQNTKPSETKTNASKKIPSESKSSDKKSTKHK
ncbi:sperm-specific protein PHI-2B/PHI-3-like [Centruroides vittatus]|uniref:sperm-specific protein PHI-2B/PHI-3-like n=1 Tax=Centruroides vittatus TaxID=120091 RepID=UPI00351011F0